MTHQGRVQVYINLINENLKTPLNDFIVAAMRNAAPNPEALDALNDALIELGWNK